MIYEEVEYGDVIEDIERLSQEGYKEVDKYNGLKLNINHELLSSMPEIQTIIAKEDDIVVGFHVTLITPDLFYQDIVTACVLFYYMTPKNRGKGRGLALFQYAEEQIKDKDADRIFMSRKIYIPNEKIFNTLEYKHIEANYTKAMK